MGHKGQGAETLRHCQGAAGLGQAMGAGDEGQPGAGFTLLQRV